MSLILNIETSTETAFVALANNEDIVDISKNPIQRDHASFLHPAIKLIMEKSGKQMSQLDAIAVTAGPGSYTGIRVGMATAKGLCFALNKPLITINSLELLTRDAITNYKSNEKHLFCPMIDARRMEVYTAIYDEACNELLPPSAIIIDETFYRKFSIKDTLVLFGSGATKCKSLSAFQNAIFIDNVNIPQAMAYNSNKAYTRKGFTDLIYSSPEYLKEFFNNK